MPSSSGGVLSLYPQLDRFEHKADEAGFMPIKINLGQNQMTHPSDKMVQLFKI